PKFERHRLLQQQARLLIFAATAPTAQHQENIDDIGFGAGPTFLQLEVIDFELRNRSGSLGRSGVWPARNCASARRSSFFLLACRSRSSSMRSTIEGSKRAIW